MTESGSSWSYRIARDEVAEQGRHVDLVADEIVRAAIARTANLLDLRRLTASFNVTQIGRDGLHIEGEVTSTIIQECVVTLEPIEQNLVEPIDLTFTPEVAEAAEAAASADDEIDPPEALVGGTVDLGAIATEYFLLGIDPYPRKPGAEFQQPGAGEAAAANPFAALAALKKFDPGGKT
jgi:uncharacterized metal-binding protein YceD (DUF177 family)